MTNTKLKHVAYSALVACAVSARTEVFSAAMSLCCPGLGLDDPRREKAGADATCLVVASARFATYFLEMTLLERAEPFLARRRVL